MNRKLTAALLVAAAVLTNVAFTVATTGTTVGERRSHVKIGDMA